MKETKYEFNESLQDRGTLILGEVFLLLGIVGLVASVLANTPLFGLWEVSLSQSIVHFALGVLALYFAVHAKHKSIVFLKTLVFLLGFSSAASLFFYAQGVQEIGGIVFGMRTFIVYFALFVIALTYTRLREDSEYQAYWQTLNSSLN